MDRPGWDQLMEYVRPADTLVVTELSRMTRSLLNLLETVKLLEQRQVNLVSLRENIDTRTATGRCFLSMMGAIHQMERELRAERAAAGRASARARGKTGGRPRTDVAKLENARVLYENSGKTANESMQNCRRWAADIFYLSRKTTRDGADSLKDEMNASDFSLQRISVLFLLERRESDRTSACACPQWPGRGEILAAPDGPFR